MIGTANCLPFLVSLLIITILTAVNAASQPTIDTPPTNKTVLQGNNVTFRVFASGGIGTLVYRWQFNGEQINNSDPGYTGAQTDTLMVLSVNAADEGRYTVVVFDEDFNIVDAFADLTVEVLPVINMDPEDQFDIPQGISVMFSVAATGANLTYQWQSGADAGSLVDIIADPNKYCGINSALLTVLNVEVSDELLYRCVVGNGAGEVASSTTQLTVLDANVAPGDTAVFTILADGRHLMYQWFVIVDDGQDIAVENSATVFGSTSNRLLLTDITEANHEGEMYYVQITNDADTVKSDIVIIRVVDPPVINSQPQSLVNQTSGVDIQFNVSVSGEGLSYQWLMDGVALNDSSKHSGVVTDTLTVMNIEFPCDEGSFNVIVSNAAGMVTSSSATLDIVEPISFVTEPQALAIAVGEDAVFSVIVSGDYPSYQWQKDGVDIVDTPDTYSGTTTATLAILSAQDIDEGSYRVRVSNTVFGVTVRSNTANLTVISSPQIVTHPVSQLSVQPGANVSFTVIASGDQLTYQWQKDGDNINDLADTYSGTQSATLTVLSVTEPDDEGVYTVVVSSFAGTRFIGLDISEQTLLEVIIATCTMLTAPTNGQVSYGAPDLVTGTVARFNCDSGFSVMGAQSLICHQEGTLGIWSGKRMVCSQHYGQVNSCRHKVQKSYMCSKIRTLKKCTQNPSVRTVTNYRRERASIKQWN